MHVTEIDGVPVYWEDVPGPLSCGLVFGCGTRDETFMTIGLTHLVEHLVMSTLPRLHHDHNATVDLFATEFVATGRPEQIAAFLEAVCRGPAALPIDRLAQEAGVLDAENGFAVHPTGAALLTRRFGARDVGLEMYAGPGHGRLGAADVVAHAAKFFVAGNAALWLTGPPPEGLRLNLPAGARPSRDEPTPLAQDGPRWSHEPVPSAGLLLAGGRDAAWNVAMAVLSERLRRDARHRRGLSYDVFGDVLPTGPATRQFLIGADARAGHDGEVAEVLWEHMRRLAAEGPTQAELDSEREGFIEAYSDPRWPAAEVAREARVAVLGLESTDQEARLRQVAEVTPADVARRLSEALPTALIALPPGAPVSLPGASEGGCPRTKTPPAGRQFIMKRFVRILARQWRPDRYYVTGDGLMRVEADADAHETRFSDVVGVEHDGEVRTLFAANGCVFHLVPSAYRDGDLLASAIDGVVPPALHYGVGGTAVPKPSTLDVVDGVFRERPRWYRLANGIGALMLALATAVLYLNWHYGYLPLWTVIVGAIVTMGWAWGARPRRRRPPIPGLAADGASADPGD